VLLEIAWVTVMSKGSISKMQESFFDSSKTTLTLHADSYLQRRKVIFFFDLVVTVDGVDDG
jgi:hypothetical protein